MPMLWHQKFIRVQLGEARVLRSWGQPGPRNFSIVLEKIRAAAPLETQRPGPIRSKNFYHKLFFFRIRGDCKRSRAERCRANSYKWVPKFYESFAVPREQNTIHATVKAVPRTAVFKG